MDFFSNCKTKEEAKATFKRLCKCFHPDKGGEEALMIELKRQYDAWGSDKSRTFRFSMKAEVESSIYDNKISELQGIIYQLRQELDRLRFNAAFDKDMFNSEASKNRRMQSEINNLNTQLEEKKQELIQERDNNKNRSLADKIKTVFGYE